MDSRTMSKMIMRVAFKYLYLNFGLSICLLGCAVSERLGCQIYTRETIQDNVLIKYTYYYSAEGKEVLHGDRIMAAHGMYSVERYKDGELVSSKICGSTCFNPKAKPRPLRPKE